MPARTERVDIVDELHHIPCMNHAAVRTEISGTVLHNPAGEEDTGEFFGSDAYPWICLRVLQQDIITRLELLYKVVFQKQSIRLRLDDGIFRIRNLRDHNRSLAGQSVRRNKILRNSLMQVLCLTHIYDIPLGVIISVDTGGMRKELYLVF